MLQEQIAMPPELDQTVHHISAKVGGNLGQFHTKPAVEIHDLSKQFGSFLAVNHLSLSIQRGEIFALLGPNGSGKTTTLNMLSGLTKPTIGTINILGYDVQRQAREIRRQLGTVAQETALYEELSAWANLEFHADLFGIPRREKKQRIEAMLDLVQLSDRQRHQVRTYSGGMKRRLALARALLHDPHLLYLDEPTLGVDVQSRRAIWDYILALREQGKTILLTTNYLEEAQLLSDRLAIIDHGALIALDTPQHLKQIYGGSIISLSSEKALSAPLVAEIRLLAGVTAVTQEGVSLTITTQGNNALVPAILNLVSRENTLCDFSVQEPSLDDIFLRLTGAELRDDMGGTRA